MVYDAIMNTISVDSNIYRGAELYAKLHNVSIGQMVEKYRKYSVNAVLCA